MKQRNKTKGTENTGSVTPHSEEVVMTPTTNKVDEVVETKETVMTSIAEAKLDTGKTVKTSEVDDDVKTVKGNVVKVFGNKIVMEVDVNGEKRNIAIPKTTQRQVLTHIEGLGQVILTFDKIKDKPGRPTNPFSTRQADLAAKNERRAELESQGLEMKRGRPAKPGSDRQERIAAYNAKKDEIRKKLMIDHPTWSHDEVEAAIELPKGRPAEAGSTRQAVLAEREAKRLKNGGVLPLGRPKEKDEEITVAEVMALTAEEMELIEA